MSAGIVATAAAGSEAGVDVSMRSGELVSSGDEYVAGGIANAGGGAVVIAGGPLVLDEKSEGIAKNTLSLLLTLLVVVAGAMFAIASGGGTPVVVKTVGATEGESPLYWGGDE